MCGSKKDVFKTWMAKTRPEEWESKSHYLEEEDGFPLNVGGLKEHTIGPEISIDVEAPVDVFAKAPPEWEQKWVNRLFPYAPAFDQCDYRRRRLFAYTIQPLVAVILMIMTGLLQTAAFLLFLVKPARWPWKGGGLSLEDPFDSCLIPDVNKGLNWLLLPVFWWLPAALLWVSVRHHHGRFDLQGIVVFGAISVPALILFLALMAFYARKFVDYTKSEGVSDRMLSLGNVILVVLGAATEPFVKFGIWFLSTSLTDEDILILTTPRQERAAMELNDLPASKRTIKLRFFDLKAKVCRPFAR